MLFIFDLINLIIMKIKLLTYFFITFLAFTSSVYAQNPVPNPGFENWTNGSPDNWFTGNIPGFGEPVTQTTPPRSGALAAKGEVLSFDGQPLVPILIATDLTGTGFNVTQRYGNLSFYYKFLPNSTESLVASAVFYNNATAVGAATLEITTTTSTFTKADLEFIYFMNTVPNKCIITFAINDSSSVFTLGSYFVIDDVELSGTVGINQSKNPTIQLKNISPNPVNNLTTINFSLLKAETVGIELFDVTGKRLLNIVSEEMAGENRKEIDLSFIPNGFYYLKMITDSGSLAIPVAVQH